MSFYWKQWKLFTALATVHWDTAKDHPQYLTHLTYLPWSHQHSLGKMLHGTPTAKVTRTAKPRTFGKPEVKICNFNANTWQMLIDPVLLLSSNFLLHQRHATIKSRGRSSACSPHNKKLWKLLQLRFVSNLWIAHIIGLVHFFLNVGTTSFLLIFS